MNEIKRKLKLLRFKFQLISLTDRMIYFLVFALVISCIYSIADKLFIFVYSPFFILFLLSCMAVIVSLVLELINTPDLLRIANKADIKAELKEQISSALEYENKKSIFAPLILERINEIAKSVNLYKAFSFNFNKKIYLLASLLIVLFALQFIPMGHTFLPKENDATRKEIKKQGEKLIELAKKVEEKKELKHISKKLDKLGNELKKKNLSKKEAMNKIDKIKKELERAKKDKENKFKSAKAMQEMMKSPLTSMLAEALSKEDFGKAMEALKELAKNMEKMNDKDKEKLKEMLSGIKDMLKDSAFEKFGRNLSESNFGGAADELAKMDALKDIMAELNDGKNNIGGTDASGLNNSKNDLSKLSSYRELTGRNNSSA